MSKSIETKVEELEIIEEEVIEKKVEGEVRTLDIDISDIKRRIEYNGKLNRLLIIAFTIMILGAMIIFEIF